MAHEGMNPNQITAEKVLDDRRVADRCTVAEVDEALARLRVSGDLVQIEQEAKSEVSPES